jgi:16S rRNA (cytosine967-C5)-methyltransferase
MPVSPARAAAFDILLRVERESSYASDLLHSAAYQNLSAPDHALATELVMGVLRWRSRLDAGIANASSQALSKLDIEILIALRLALYQFLWLDRIPRRAALHESVELVKRARKRSAAPFVNAVLRKLSTAAQRHDVPVELELSSPETLASALAHPLWLVERWARQHGFSAARSVCEYDQTIPTASIRLRTSHAEEQLREDGITLSPGALLASARRVESGDITKTSAFRTGQVVIQDEASQLVAALVGTASQILDCCAAPGGKTLAIADHNPNSAITAVELHPHRARLLRKRLPRESQIQIVNADARHLPLSQPFERVLADVPCSGTGTLARNPEIKWRFTLDDLAELHERQIAILRSALHQVGPRGRVIYSTCSLEKEENEDVVEEALSKNQGVRLVDCHTELERLKTTGELVWPDTSLARGQYLRIVPGVHPCDGFFAAILEKI